MNEHKSKEQLLNDLIETRRRVSELEDSETTLKQAEENLQAESENFRNVLEAMDDGVYIVNQEYDIEYVNSVLKNGFGEVENRKCYNYFHNLEEVCPWCKNKDVFEGKTVRWVWYSNKTERTYDLIDTPLKNPDGSISKLEIFRDITDRVLLEEELKESEQKFHLLADHTFDWVQWTDPEGNYIYISPSCERITGYSPEEFISNQELLFELVRPDYFKKVRHHYDDENDEEYPVFSMQYPIITKNGEERWMEHNCSPVFDQQSNYVGRRGNNRDITKRVRAEDRAQHLNLVLRSIRKINQLIVTEKNRDEIIRKVCEILVENRGYNNAWIVLLDENGEYLSSAESGLGKSFTPLKKMLEKGELMVCGSKALEKRGPVIVENPAIECGDCPLSHGYEGRSGFTISIGHGDNLFGLLVVSVPKIYTTDKEEQGIFLEIGEDIGFALNNIEIGKKRERAEEALLENEERYRAVVENSHNGILIVSEDFKFEYVNDQLCQILGRNREEIIGHDFREFMEGESEKLVADRYLRRQRGEEVPERYEFNVFRKDSGQRRVEISSAIVRDSKGKVKTIAQLMDITERVRAEEEIRQRTEELTLINAINTAVNRGMDLPEIIKLLAEEAKRVFNSKSTTVYLCSEDQKYLEMKNLAMAPSTVKRIEKLIGTSFPNIRIPLKEGSLTQELLQADGPRLINDSEIIQEWMLEFTHAVDLSEKSRQTIQKLISQIYKLVGVQSIITVPMISAGEPIGLMDFSRREPFTEGDAKRVAGVVGQVTAAITSLRAEKEKARSQRLLLALSQAAPAVQRAGNAKEIYKAIEEQTGKIGFEVTVFTLSEDKKHLVLFYQNLKSALVRILEKLTNASVEGYSLPLKAEGYFHKIITNKETVFSHIDTTLIEEFLPRLSRSLSKKMMDILNQKQGIIAPLIVGDEVKGLMTFAGSDLSEKDVPTIAIFANQAAIALENARLFQDTKKHLSQMSALRKIDQAIIGSLDLKVTLNIILDHLLAQLEVDAAAVLSYQADLQTLQFTHGRGFQTDALQYTDLRLGQGCAGKVGLQRNHVFIPDLKQDQGKIQESPQFSEEGFVAYYGVPLVAKGKLVGVLEIFHRSPLAPDDEWVNYLEMLSGQAAIAIDNITLFDDLQRSNVDLTLAYDATIEGWAHALELKDMETEGHSRRVVELTMDMAQIMGISGEKLLHVRRGALLHDIGKMGIPDSILLKPGKLTDEEWEIMKQHPVYAYEWLSRIEYLRPALDIPYYHHEKWDGSGYPRSLEGEQIPLEARIFAIVDVWDALLSDRPYRKAWSKEKTIAYLKEQSGKHFDPRVVDMFLEQLS